MDLEGKLAKKPFKPFLTQPGEHLKETLTKDAMDEMDILEASTATEEIERGRFGNRGSFKPRRPFGKFNKGPNTKCSRVSGRPINKDKSRCFKCKEFGHFQDECPTNKSS